MVSQPISTRLLANIKRLDNSSMHFSSAQASATAPRGPFLAYPRLKLGVSKLFLRFPSRM